MLFYFSQPLLSKYWNLVLVAKMYFKKNVNCSDASAGKKSQKALEFYSFVTSFAERHRGQLEILALLCELNSSIFHSGNHFIFVSMCILLNLAKNRLKVNLISCFPSITCLRLFFCPRLLRLNHL